MAKQPWASTDARTLAVDQRPRGWAEALESPCGTCETAPCCSYLPVHSFRVDNLSGLDHARYLLNFERIELGLTPDGEWGAYYRCPCRYLDRETFLCALHETSEQPSICRHYSPYSCWYRRVLRGPVSESCIRIDRPRIDFILANTLFDDDRKILEVPRWDAMLEAFAAMAPVACDDGEPAADPVFAQWRREVVGAVSEPPAKPRQYRLDGLPDPCDGCAAPCCTTLVFPRGFPANASNLDYLRFCLGFSGVELGITEKGWTLVIKTRCRHLDGDRCGSFGKTARPLICTYYDASRCTYKKHFGGTPAPDLVRVRLEDFGSLAGCFRFDESGTILAGPDTPQIREAIERRWREEATEGAPGGSPPSCA